MTDQNFEERADQLTMETLMSETVTDDLFTEIDIELRNRGLTLVVGPRGCGKTHMMRFTHIRCQQRKKEPFSAYVSFNRYLRLEPLLKNTSNAISQFSAWVLARIVLASWTSLSEINSQSVLISEIEQRRSELTDLVDRLERGIALDQTAQEVADRLSIDVVVSEIRKCASEQGRKRTVVLLDDAALTLTPEYMIEFFSIIRALKANDIAPKISVYPGTTEYGPTFHADHEGRIRNLWLSPESQQYEAIMGKIRAKRFPDSSTIAEDQNKLLMYAAFGVPRAYLTMLREALVSKNGVSNTLVAQIIRAHWEARLDEFRSLALKLPKFGTFVEIGEEFVKEVVNEISIKNSSSGTSRQLNLFIGIPTRDLSSALERMLNLLVEVGLMREEGEVSHGRGRKYARYFPHLAGLIAERALIGSSRSSAPTTVLDALKLKRSKHPVRLSSKFLDKVGINNLRIDLPACAKCGTARLPNADGQRFCHHCGAELLGRSTFETCMGIAVEAVPGITKNQKDRMAKQGKFKTVGDFLSRQDVGSKLREIDTVGPIRARQIITAVDAHIDEFIS